MCGISGIVNFNNDKVASFAIDKLTDSLSHRGPDGRGVWFNKDKNLALGHRRLSILDLTEAGHQPMVSERENLVIAQNGEIYNFIELRLELINLGYNFVSDTDTEVVLKAYNCWGLKMLNKFNGMWAIAIYDKNKDELILSRDRFGIKPLYYYYDKDEFVFASEVQAIHKHLGVKAKINKNVIDSILRFDHTYHSTVETYITDVKSLKAGENLHLFDNKISTHEWYSLHKVDVPKSFKEQAAKLKKLLIDACKLRLRSDVAIGTCLSGGIDSGAISSLINNINTNDDERFSNYTHRSFCAGFPGIDFDESNEAIRLANQLDIELDIEMINAPGSNFLENAMKKSDGPMPSSAFFPIWQLYGYIKSQNITVTLDGMGADEMLGGYYLGYEAMKGALELRDVSWLYDIKKTYGAISKRGNQMVQGHFKDLKRDIFIKIDQAVKFPIKKLLSIFKLYEFKKNSDNGNKLEEPAFKRFNNTFDKALYKQFYKTPLPFYLHQYDRASMANGVECRMPFMDYRVVEYVFSLPPKSKVGGGYTKRVLREALKDVLPDETRLNKIKTGFNAPTIDWFQAELNDWFIKEITSQSFYENPYFDGPKVSREFLEALNSEKVDDYMWKFWSYVHVNYWYTNFN